MRTVSHVTRHTSPITHHASHCTAVQQVFHSVAPTLSPWTQAPMSIGKVVLFSKPLMSQHIDVLPIRSSSSQAWHMSSPRSQPYATQQLRDAACVTRCCMCTTTLTIIAPEPCMHPAAHLLLQAYHCCRLSQEHPSTLHPQPM